MRLSSVAASRFRARSLALLGALGVGFAFSLAAPVDAFGKTRLFILSGQSNMAGLDPKVSFTPAVTAAFPDDEVIVVKDAQGGQPIRRWYKQWKLPSGAQEDSKTAGKQLGDLYDQLMKKVREATGDRKIDTVVFVWMQGERDAKVGWQEVYADALRGLVGQLRQDLGRSDIGVVIGRLSDVGNGQAGWDAVRAAQEKVASDEPLGAWVDTDDLNDKDGKNDLHYSKDGYAELGKRFAAKAIELSRKQESSGK